MLFEYKIYLPRMLKSRKENTAYNAGGEIQAYRRSRAVRPNGESLDRDVLNNMVRTYELIADEDVEGFKQHVDDISVGDKSIQYLLFDKYSVMRAALAKKYVLYSVFHRTCRQELQREAASSCYKACYAIPYQF